MEWALAVPRGQALGWVKDIGTEIKKGQMAAIWEVVQAQLGPINYNRLYFGQEFCEKALPTAKELAEALDAAKNRGMEFTLVTPYITEEGLVRVNGLLEQLAKLKPQAEVVVNDWGVLELVNRDYPMLIPVLGRLLNKVLRDPRMMKHLSVLKDDSPNEDKTIDRNESEKSLESFRRSSLAGEPMRDLLTKYKVKRIEMDLPLQGLDEKLPEWGYDLSLYLPYGVITTGRICLMHSWGKEDQEKFKPVFGGCDRKCRHYWLKMTDPSRQVPKSKEWSIVQKGNTMFYRQEKEFIAKGMQAALKAGISRLVIQREPL